MAFANGYDMGLHYNTDHLGVVYITLAAIWTLALAIGIGLLLKNRHLPYLRIRNLPLVISAVITLHVYWVLTLLAYILNGFFPCGTEYWIMSVYLPLGIAMYHASNTQLLHISKIQKRFANETYTSCNNFDFGTGKSKWANLSLKIRSYTTTKQTMCGITVGMIVQLACALIIFMISRKFHPSFGIVGQEVDMLVCRRGWEWLPSIVWQFFWSWGFAPYLLWRVRRIQDVHGWRTQTICCCLAGLPASPMWLISLYVPAMASVNKYVVPPLWFSPSILIMQGFAIFSPCRQILKNHKLQNETQDIIEEWENKQNRNGSVLSGVTRVGSELSKSPTLTSYCSRRGEMYTMRTMEKTLLINPRPLLLFAALKDFSGENISFLTHVNDWKAGWNRPSGTLKLVHKSDTQLSDDEGTRRSQFIKAVEIYCSFVSLEYSDFPINLSSAHLKELQSLFDHAATLVNAPTSPDSIAPFRGFWESRMLDGSNVILLTKETTISSHAPSSNGSFDKISLASESHRESYFNNFKTIDLTDRIPQSIPIPDSFGPAVFENAEQSIKQLVLTNSWPKFVNCGLANNIEKGKVTFKDRIAHRVDFCGLWCPQT